MSLSIGSMALVAVLALAGCSESRSHFSLVSFHTHQAVEDRKQQSVKAEKPHEIGWGERFVKWWYGI